MPPVGRGVVVRCLLSIVACVVVAGVAGCSDDEPLIRQDVAEEAPVPSVPISSPTKDGKPADAAQVAAVVARITDVGRADRPVGLDGVRSFYRVQVLAIGLTDAEADCAADRMVAAGGDDLEEATIADLLSGIVGVDATVMTACVAPDRLMAMAETPPDFLSVAPQLRTVMTELSVDGLSAAGLTTDEAACVAAQTITAIPDTQLTEAIGGLGSINSGLPEAVARCLTAARISELAEH